MLSWKFHIKVALNYFSDFKSGYIQENISVSLFEQFYFLISSINKHIYSDNCFKRREFIGTKQRKNMADHILGSNF